MKRKPLVIDLCCGRGGWALGFLKFGWRVIGVDIVRYKDYPARVLQADVGSLELSDVRPPDRNIDLVVASPPCTEFSKADQPGLFPNLPAPSLDLVNACFKFAEAAGCPIVLENVRGLQRFMEPAIAHYGSFYLWGDGVPPLMPHIAGRQGRPRLKWKHRSPGLRAKIPIELSTWIAQVHTNRISNRVVRSAANQSEQLLSDRFEDSRLHTAQQNAPQGG